MLEQNRVMDDAAGTASEPVGEPVEVALARRVSEPPEAEVVFANSSLTAAQALALRALAEGASLNDAAKAAGVERNALYRWRTRNSHFIAAMNAWRREQLEAARDEFLLLRDSAMQAVRQGLDKKDARLGMRVLDRLGVSTPGETTPTLPTKVESPEIEHPEAEMQWRLLEDDIRRLPIELQKLVPALVRYGGQIYNKWGMEILSELAEAYRARLLSPEQAKTIPYLIVTALDSAASLLEHTAVDQGGAP